jgi:ketosteroid isomerase-like protein
MAPHDRFAPLAVAHRYLEALAASNRAVVETLLAPDVVYRELPNRLNPRGSVRDRRAMLEAFDRGIAILSAQGFAIERSVVQGETVALEVAWTGTLAVAMGALAPGDTLRARFAMFVDVRAGQVVRQHNYDCFDEF